MAVGERSDGLRFPVLHRGQPLRSVEIGRGGLLFDRAVGKLRPNLGRRPHGPSRPPLRYGHISHFSTWPPRKSVIRFGASRNDSALPVGGVSITMPSQASVVASSYSRSMAMYSWVPARVSAIRW